jgi:hypothetical protein
MIENFFVKVVSDSKEIWFLMGYKGLNNPVKE